MNHMKIVRDKNRYNFPAQKFGRVLFVVAKLSSLAELKDARHILHKQNMPRVSSR